MRVVLFALLLSLCSQASAHAETALLSASDSGRGLNAHVTLLADPGAELNIDDLQRPDVKARFVPAEGKASVGQSPHPWWIRVSLQRESDAPFQWWLEVGSVTLKDLRIYLPDGNGGWIERQSRARELGPAGRASTARRSTDVAARYTPGHLGQQLVADGPAGLGQLVDWHLRAPQLHGILYLRLRQIGEIHRQHVH